MYSILLFIVIYNVGRIAHARRYGQRKNLVTIMVAIYFIGSLSLIPYANVFYGEECKRRETIGVAALALSAVASFLFYWRTSSRTRVQHQYAFAALAFLLVGVVFHTADETRVWCWPESLVNGT